LTGQDGQEQNTVTCFQKMVKENQEIQKVLEQDTGKDLHNTETTHLLVGCNEL